MGRIELSLLLRNPNQWTTKYVIDFAEFGGQQSVSFFTNQVNGTRYQSIKP
jgi:hypothetical protein